MNHHFNKKDDKLINRIYCGKIMRSVHSFNLKTLSGYDFCPLSLALSPFCFDAGHPAKQFWLPYADASSLPVPVSVAGFPLTSAEKQISARVASSTGVGLVMLRYVLLTLLRFGRDRSSVRRSTRFTPACWLPRSWDHCNKTAVTVGRNSWSRYISA